MQWRKWGKKQKCVAVAVVRWHFRLSSLLRGKVMGGNEAKEDGQGLGANVHSLSLSVPFSDSTLPLSGVLYFCCGVHARAYKVNILYISSKKRDCSTAGTARIILSLSLLSPSHPLSLLLIHTLLPPSHITIPRCSRNGSVCVYIYIHMCVYAGVVHSSRCVLKSGRGRITTKMIYNPTAKHNLLLTVYNVYV